MMRTEVMRTEVNIPFKKEMKALILAGRKRCTSRTRKYGDTGDEFRIGRNRYMITFTVKRSLRYVAEYLYTDEGFNTPEDFVKYWKKLHPKKEYDPDQQVWVHYFVKV